MTRDDIIRMAREAGISKPWDQEPVKWETLERFATLVYAEAHKDGLDDFEAVVLPAAIKAEREACAKVLDEMADDMVREMEPSTAIAYVRSKAAEIRSRGQQ